MKDVGFFTITLPYLTLCHLDWAPAQAFTEYNHEIVQSGKDLSDHPVQSFSNSTKSSYKPRPFAPHIYAPFKHLLRCELNDLPGDTISVFDNFFQ